MSAHPHAELMKLYAEDAAETDKPWKWWEYKDAINDWGACSRHPSWATGVKYRRRKTSRERFEEWFYGGADATLPNRSLVWEAWQEAWRQAKEEQ